MSKKEIAQQAALALQSRPVSSLTTVEMDLARLLEKDGYLKPYDGGQIIGSATDKATGERAKKAEAKLAKAPNPESAWPFPKVGSYKL